MEIIIKGCSMLTYHCVCALCAQVQEVCAEELKKKKVLYCDNCLQGVEYKPGKYLVPELIWEDWGDEDN